MRKIFKLLGIFALVAVIGFSIAACDNGTGGGDPSHVHLWGAWTVTNTSLYPATSTRTCSGCAETETRDTEIGDTGPGGGIIIYVSTAGFTVTGTGSFTAHYLEAAPANMATTLKWCSHTGSPWCDVTTGIAIGTGKANTAAIIAAHSGDTAANNAAKACAEYSNNDKPDWFLPSQYELYEMYNARTHVGISSGQFWSSSQSEDAYVGAWYQDFGSGGIISVTKNYDFSVRAVRAF